MEAYLYSPAANPAPESRLSGSAAAPDLQVQSTLLPYLLDELQIALSADAAALIRYYPTKREAVVEAASGSWKAWSDLAFSLSREQLKYLTTVGADPLSLTSLSSVRSPLTDPSVGFRCLYHTPVPMPGNALAALWVGLPQTCADQNNHLLQMASDLVSNALESNCPDPSRRDTLAGLAQCLAGLDPSLYQRALRMLPMMQNAAQALGMDEPEVELAGWAALLHDIGSLSLPGRIFNKPGPLEQNEWPIIRLHPGVGARMIPRLKSLVALREIILTHHERYDGSGYPLGLAGDMIPYSARILAVVDAYAAMTESRPYRNALTTKEAASRIRNSAGSQFDPEICKAFLTTI